MLLPVDNTLLNKSFYIFLKLCLASVSFVLFIFGSIQIVAQG